jgi:hypothetical protein
MKKTTVLMAAMLAVATVLAAGLTVLPGSVQEAQANPCSNNIESNDNEGNGGGGDTVTAGGDQICDLTGYFEFDEDGTSDSGLAATETDGAEATETDGAEATTGNNIIDDPLFDLADAFDESD